RRRPPSPRKAPATWDAHAIAIGRCMTDAIGLRLQTSSLSTWVASVLECNVTAAPIVPRYLGGYTWGVRGSEERTCRMSERCPLNTCTRLSAEQGSGQQQRARSCCSV